MEAKLILAYILLVVQATLAENEYCSLESCPNKTHTLCKYQIFGLAKKCLNPIQNTEINEEDQKYIIQCHQLYRIPRLLQQEDLIELPLEIDLDSPLLRFEWDQELAMIAQQWANQCEEKPDTCRNVARFNVTQRHVVYETALRIAQRNTHIIFASIEGLYLKDFDERQNLTKISPTNFWNFTSDFYSRIAWGSANKIGCGLVKTKQLPRVTSYFVCNYGYMVE